MGDRRELRAFAVVVLLIGVVSATTMMSCGGSSDGDSNGNLCEECGDTDGPCNANGAVVSGDDRPTGCGTTDPCTVELRCRQKVDSGQRRCFPLDPSTHQLDLRYECDGSRPRESFAATITPTPVPTLTASPTLSPSATTTPESAGPTATGPTPSGTPSPEATATPAEIDVTINVETSADELPHFTARVSYTPAKGSFTPLDCDDSGDGIGAQDNGSGILTLTFASNPDGSAAVSTTCVFHQLAGHTLVDGDLNASVDPPELTIEIEDL